MQHNNSEKAKLFLEILGQEIKEERIKLNKSQRLLADEYDCQKSMISRIESAVNEAKILSLYTICEALNIKLSDLIKRVENKLPKDFSLIEK